MRNDYYESIFVRYQEIIDILTSLYREAAKYSGRSEYLKGRAAGYHEALVAISERRKKK